VNGAVGFFTPGLFFTKLILNFAFKKPSTKEFNSESSEILSKNLALKVSPLDVLKTADVL